MMFTNAILTRIRAGEVMDHGVPVPHWDNPETLQLGRFSVQPAGGAENNERALAADTLWIAYGPPETILDAEDEVRVRFDSGRRFLAAVSAPVDYWESPIGHSHVRVQLKNPEERNR